MELRSLTFLAMHFMHHVHLSSYYLFNLLSLGIIYIQWGQRPLAHFCNSTGQLYWNCCEFLGRLVIKKNTCGRVRKLSGRIFPWSLKCCWNVWRGALSLPWQWPPRHSPWPRDDAAWPPAIYSSGRTAGGPAASSPPHCEPWRQHYSSSPYSSLISESINKRKTLRHMSTRRSLHDLISTGRRPLTTDWLECLCSRIFFSFRLSLMLNLTLW